jgi:hypothetical protein
MESRGAGVNLGHQQGCKVTPNNKGKYCVRLNRVNALKIY